MRVTSAATFDTSIHSLQQRQQRLIQAQAQVSSGKRLTQASDDPAAAARAERALAALERAEADERALQASRSAMHMSESVLGQAGELMQQVRERLMEAGNGAYGDSERAVLANAIEGLRQDLLHLANRDDGAGRPLFSGQGGGAQPFVDAVGGVQYQASPGQLSTSTGERLPLALDGEHVWLKAPAAPGGAATPISVFDVLDGVVNQLRTPGLPMPTVAAQVRANLAKVDELAAHLSSWRSMAGQALAHIDQVQERLASGRLQAQTERSAAEDADMVQAISNQQAQQSGYEAALKAYASVQRLSLFNFMS